MKLYDVMGPVVGALVLGIALFEIVDHWPLPPQTVASLCVAWIVLAALIAVFIVSASMRSAQISRERGED